MAIEITTKTKAELQKEHDLYTKSKAAWKFFKDSYYGGERYREGNYLEQHPFESDKNYSRRKNLAYFYNYCSLVVDVLTSYATKEPPKRDYGSLTGDAPVPPREPKTLFDSFWYNCDYEGTNFDQFMIDAIRWAGVFRRVSILVDKPNADVSTEGEQLDQDIRPYLILITPDNLLDWLYERIDGKPTLTFIKIKETNTTYKLWYTTHWELWNTDTQGEPEIIGFGDNPLGKIPLVNLYNKRTLERMDGLSDLEDIAGINKNIYHFCSDANEIIENTAFPMLAMPSDGVGSTEEDPDTVGPRNILTFDPATPNAVPQWLEAPHTSLAEIREWVQQDAEEIVRLAKMGGVRNVETSTQPWSGTSIEAQEKQLEASIGAKTTSAEQVELDIFQFFAEWENSSFDGDVRYPTEFAIKDATVALQNAINAQSATVMSKTFDKEIQKVIVDNSLRSIDENTRATILKEIDDSKVEDNNKNLPSKTGEEVVEGADANPGSVAKKLGGEE